MISREMLKEYTYLSGEIETLEEEIETLGAKILSAKPPKIDGMPHTGSTSDGADLIIKYLELQDLMQVKMDRNIRLYRDIDRETEMLPPEIKYAVRYKYIHGMSAAQIAEKMHYSERQIQRLLKQGMEMMDNEQH